MTTLEEFCFQSSQRFCSSLPSDQPSDQCFYSPSKNKDSKFLEAGSQSVLLFPSCPCNLVLGPISPAVYWSNKAYHLTEVVIFQQQSIKTLKRPIEIKLPSLPGCLPPLVSLIKPTLFKGCKHRKVAKTTEPLLVDFLETPTTFYTSSAWANSTLACYLLPFESTLDKNQQKLFIVPYQHTLEITHIPVRRLPHLMDFRKAFFVCFFIFYLPAWRNFPDYNLTTSTFRSQSLLSQGQMS